MVFSAVRTTLTVPELPFSNFILKSSAGVNLHALLIENHKYSINYSKMVRLIF